ncbi:hypothetical protein K4A83_08940 [Spirulina subsalsa FACHB-351]|uniref:Uncharacterized protein n=1 Tax=Spirulina subsalsa FACHB-351 TaxID=234711 RepID=A0ABT3L4F6_9CYAN|nr:hypothetical protein [Spirulina subsalsa]MCW6036393.1 hypothetical protein [Spirulina subsalsa FACHB-351]
MKKFRLITHSTAALCLVGLHTQVAQASTGTMVWQPDEEGGGDIPVGYQTEDRATQSLPTTQPTTLVPLSPAASYTPIEKDPYIRAAIDPGSSSLSPAELQQLTAEDVIRDGRSFAELINPSSEQIAAKTTGLTPEEQAWVEADRQARISAAPVESAPVATREATPRPSSEPPMLAELEADLQRIRTQVAQLSTETLDPAPVIRSDFVPDSLPENVFSKRDLGTTVPDLNETDFQTFAGALGWTEATESFAQIDLSFLKTDLFSQDLTQMAVESFSRHLWQEEKNPLVRELLSFEAGVKVSPLALQADWWTEMAGDVDDLLKGWDMALNPVLGLEVNPVFGEVDWVLESTFDLFSVQPALGQLGDFSTRGGSLIAQNRLGRYGQ